MVGLPASPRLSEAPRVPAAALPGSRFALAASTPVRSGALDTATLGRTRAGLRSYAAAIVTDVPFVWGLEEFVMFLDSDEKGRRLFGDTRKKETHM